MYVPCDFVPASEAGGTYVQSARGKGLTPGSSGTTIDVVVDVNVGVRGELMGTASGDLLVGAAMAASCSALDAGAVEGRVVRAEVAAAAVP
ncbi:uncharacterized protein N7529_011157 [Penicillium soppii]|uniref:uncharacterized protein n=1 Tax=Penicillium soppii TaxID=69789 RepID=UPI002548F1C6|nr:uncharacterized protein N7529_011157 [Penicillium soppii]KAJ5851772.1 hypothetical protein N7529_011157 [Penicillium soppii]